jgi:glycerophosphoryl diester phosphodiesterase
MATIPVPTSPAVRPTNRGRAALAVAHRGASDVAPENTLSAVRRAVAAGADLVEVDVRRTRDGALVVLHDATLVRTTDATRVLPGRGPWSVEDLTLAEVRRLDAGSWKDPRFAGEQVPTLEEVLEALAGRRTGLLVELKEPATTPGLVVDVAAVLASLADPSVVRVAVQSFDHDTMRELREIVPHLSVGVLGRPPRTELRWYAEWAVMVNPPGHRLDREYVDEVHRWGMASLVWTVDHPTAMQRALATGVDGVITNSLSALHRVLRQPRGRLTRPRHGVAAAVP